MLICLCALPVLALPGVGSWCEFCWVGFVGVLVLCQLCLGNVPCLVCFVCVVFVCGWWCAVCMFAFLSVCYGLWFPIVGVLGVDLLVCLACLGFAWVWFLV